jgi:hypothetical protein
MRMLSVASLLVVLIGSLLSSAQQKPPEAAATRIDEVMRARSVAGDFDGTVLVAREGRILYERGFGFDALGECASPSSGRA